MTNHGFQQQSRDLIDGLKAVCAQHGLGNDGNEYKIIVQCFLYKLLCDKFAHELKALEPKLAEAEDWVPAWLAMPENERELLDMQLGADVPRIQPEQLLSQLFARQNEGEFARRFDDTLRDIAAVNNEIFAVTTAGGAKITLFDRLSEYISDPGQRDAFCRAMINKLVSVSFEHLFQQKYDFYSALFEYLIKDYNKDNGGKYAEYYTPHAVATIMAHILVPEEQRGTVKNVSCYDPSSGSGTLLMALAHAIGEDNCSIWAQDISQKSSSLLRLNLVLNKLVHSIPHVRQGNTILQPAHLDKASPSRLQKFDYIVSNPPFKMDFSDFRNDLPDATDKADPASKNNRFFAGIPKIPAKAKDKMAIYLLFIQHIMASLKEGGKAAVVVPTGFITAQAGIDKKIRQKLVDEKMIAGVVSMPSNIFATTGTNVSILFINKASHDDVVLIDASKLGTKVKEGKNQKTLLSHDEEQQIIRTFNAREAVDDFSVVVGYDEIAAKNYSFSAGQYFDVKIEYQDITPPDFENRIEAFETRLNNLFSESRDLEAKISVGLKELYLD